MVKWWKKSTFYEIYMPSFKDGNGDVNGKRESSYDFSE